MMQITYSEELQSIMPVNTHAEKLAEAIAWMGRRHVLHPANRVKRLETPLEPYVWKPKVLRGRK